MDLIIQVMFVVMHALVTPLLTLITHPDMRRQVVQLIRSTPEHPEENLAWKCSGSGRSEAEEEENSQDTDSEAGGRKHRSALETVCHGPKKKEADQEGEEEG